MSRKAALSRLEQKMQDLWDIEPVTVRKKKKSLAVLVQHESPAAESLDSPSAETPEEPAAPPTVPVVVFDQSAAGQPAGSTKSKREWKAFMSSSIKSVAGRKQTAVLTKQEEEQDRLDDQHDKELMDLLQTTQLVRDYGVLAALTLASSELSGKDRRKYIQARLVELGGKPAKLPKVSLPMHLGMIKAAQARVTKGVQDAKDLGTYTNSLKNELTGKEQALRYQAASARTRPKVDKGLIGSMGKIRKNGTMTVSKRLIESVEQGKSGKQRLNKRGTGFGPSSVGKKTKPSRFF
ncbi:hypothetical protein HDV03_003684 [Kappamyces sp. JEL0829]|nr:hypothetical protein HDV03_003684 [Kappamyces sp. JEL0829]